MGELVTREDLRLALENLDLRLTARIEAQTKRLGMMIAVAVGVLGTMVALF